MDGIIIAFGVASIMLVVGILLRAKTSLFQKILMPAPVIGGIVGLILITIFRNKITLFSAQDFTPIVDVFFVFSFISVGLSSKKQEGKLSREEKKKLSKEERKSLKNSTVISGAMSLGLVWCAIYGIQAFAGGALCGVFGKFFDITVMHGVLLSFGFSQGPGQSVTYGQIFENSYGVVNAEQIALAFAVFGFLSAFVVGVPLARFGLKKKISNRKGQISEIEKRGYYKLDEEGRSLGRATTYGGNIETITTHFAFIGIAYVISLGFSKVISYVPGIGESFAAMKFFWGMISGTIIRSVLRKLKLEYILDDMLLSRVTSFLTDFVVVSAFMSVELVAFGKLLIPIILVSLIVTVITLVVSIFFCERMGSDHDFEKLLGLFGTSTGTVSSGISLIRIVDPMLTTTTAQELGCINIVGIFSAPIITLSTLAGTGVVSQNFALIGFLVSAIVDVVILAVLGGFNKKKSFSLVKKADVTDEAIGA